MCTVRLPCGMICIGGDPNKHDDHDCGEPDTPEHQRYISTGNRSRWEA